MTNLPVAAATPIDFSTPPVPTQAEAASKESTTQWSGVVKLGRREFNILPKVPLAVSIEMDAAQDSGDAGRIVDSFLNVLRPEDRPVAQEYAKADEWESDEDIVSLTDLIDAVRNAQEQMAARPTNR